MRPDTTRLDTTSRKRVETKKPNNPYARPMIVKCFKCGESRHRFNDYRRQKSINLIEGHYEPQPFDEKGELCEPNGVTEKICISDDDVNDKTMWLRRCC